MKIQYKVLRHNKVDEFEKMLNEQLNKENIVVLGLQYTTPVADGRIYNNVLVEYYLKPKPAQDDKA